MLRDPPILGLVDCHLLKAGTTHGLLYKKLILVPSMFDSYVNSLTLFIFTDISYIFMMTIKWEPSPKVLMVHQIT